jgi:hypothetical protein
LVGTGFAGSVLAGSGCEQNMDNKRIPYGQDRYNIRTPYGQDWDNKQITEGLRNRLTDQLDFIIGYLRFLSLNFIPQSQSLQCDMISTWNIYG